MIAPTIIPPDWSLPEELSSRLGDRIGRQRALYAHGHLLLVLHNPPAADDPIRTGHIFWRNPQGEWKINSPGDAKIALHHHLQHYANASKRVDDRLQTATSAHDYFGILRSLTPLYRSARNLHATLQDARQMVHGNHKDLINLRDRSVEIERHLELLLADARNSMDFTVAYLTELQHEQAQAYATAVYRFNILAATFFPMATLGSIFGMNVAHGFEPISAPWAFVAILGLGLLLGLFVTWIVTRRIEPIKVEIPKPISMSDLSREDSLGDQS